MPPGLDSPAASFDQPYEMLEACHDRVHRTLRLLVRLIEHLDARGADLMARDAARDVLRYFDRAAPHHHEDEERHVFPPLLAGGEERLVALVRRLRSDHRTMEDLWSRLRPVLEDIAHGRRAAWPAGARGDADAFVALYEAHIALEEEAAYPAARPRMHAGSLEAMSRDMAVRRGVEWPTPSGGRG